MAKRSIIRVQIRAQIRVQIRARIRARIRAWMRAWFVRGCERTGMGVAAAEADGLHAAAMLLKKYVGIITERNYMYSYRLTQRQSQIDEGKCRMFG